MKISFEQLTAKANKGNRKAQLKIGEIFLSTRRYADAIPWLTRAAERNDPVAQLHLGFLYYQGLGVAKNDAKAVEYLKLSAEQDNPEAQAQLGAFYLKGIGTYPDEQMALFWTRKAALTGNALGIFNLGVSYFQGVGMPKNPDKARQYLLKASANGNESAKKILIENAEYFRSVHDNLSKNYMQDILDSLKPEEPPAPAPTLSDNFDDEEFNDDETEETV